MRRISCRGRTRRKTPRVLGTVPPQVIRRREGGSVATRLRRERKRRQRLAAVFRYQLLDEAKPRNVYAAAEVLLRHHGDVVSRDAPLKKYVRAEWDNIVDIDRPAAFSAEVFGRLLIDTGQLRPSDIPGWSPPPGRRPGAGRED